MAPELMTTDAVIRTDSPHSNNRVPDSPVEATGPSGGPFGQESLCTMADLDQLVAELDDVDATLASLR